MVFVSWQEAVTFCRALQRYVGEPWRRGVVRLPTEAEWEYACRAGTTTTFSFGAEASSLKAKFAPPAAGTNQGPLPVRSFPANPWGLYDMHGNVAEWVRGGAVRYPGKPVEDWFVPETSAERLYRGGSWKQPATSARSAHRNWKPDGAAADYIGFRVVWTPRNENMNLIPP